MRKILPIGHIMGSMLMFFSFTFILPILTSAIYKDDSLVDFMEAFMITFGAGFLVWFFTRNYNRELHPRDGYLLVVLGWTVMAGAATLPLLLHFRTLSFTDAYFETMSGLTTTGSTVLVNLDQLSPAINLWRHELSWLGGMGIIVLAVAILPLLGVGGMQLYKAETPGPMKDTKLTPRITETAKSLWLVYAVITVVCIIALRLAGMNWLDAICHAFSAMSLGGFSTHDTSVGFFDSVSIELILMIFMLIAGVNFATHFVVWHRKSFKPYLQDIEAKAFLILMVVSCLIISFFLWKQNIYEHFLTALRHGSFSVISVATTTGFVTADFNLWPIFVPLWMLLLSGIATCSGSTGGGIKMIRAILICKQANRELRKLIHPAAVLPIKADGQILQNKVVFSVLGFAVLYMVSVVALTFLLLISGLDFMSAFSAIVACINNAGPGLNQVGPATTYAILSDFQTWVCTFAMLLGRLEIFTLLVLFTRTFWRK